MQSKVCLFFVYRFYEEVFTGENLTDLYISVYSDDIMYIKDNYNIQMPLFGAYLVGVGCAGNGNH